MIDHIGFPVSDYERSKAFYLKALAPLDYTLVMEVTQEQTGHDPAAGFGANGKPDFWIGGEGGLDKPLHVAIVAKDRATVDAFYKAAHRRRRTRQWRARDPRALSPELLRRVRARSRRPQHRGRLPHAGVSGSRRLRLARIARELSREYIAGPGPNCENNPMQSMMGAGSEHSRGCVRSTAWRHSNALRPRAPRPVIAASLNLREM